jgi:hypothetical protein
VGERVTATWLKKLSSSLVAMALHKKVTKALFSVAQRLVITPKAFANFSPGFELARTLGT